MNTKLKEQILQEVLKSTEIDYLMLDSLVDLLHTEENTVDMLTKYYLSFFVSTHGLEVGSLQKDLLRVSLYERRSIIFEVCMEVGLTEMFLFYEELLKTMNKEHKMNAVDVLRSIIDNSEETMQDILKELGDLSILETKE